MNGAPLRRNSFQPPGSTNVPPTKEPSLIILLVKALWIFFAFGLFSRGLWESGKLGWMLLDYLR